MTILKTQLCKGGLEGRKIQHEKLQEKQENPN
uniref:Uncharacterized protein n=1 Tax=Rhizophora mucronata TaxID=61149 RepID=A0A2P2N7C5_RHIMU